MSPGDTYDVVQLGVDTLWFHCRQCGYTWDATGGVSWRCPAEHLHGEELLGPFHSSGGRNFRRLPPEAAG